MSATRRPWKKPVRPASIGQLVITRRENDSIWIGDVQVLVARCETGKVRLLIRAPQEVQIIRDELIERLDREESAAS